MSKLLSLDTDFYGYTEAAELISKQAKHAAGHCKKFADEMFEAIRAGNLPAYDYRSGKLLSIPIPYLTPLGVRPDEVNEWLKTTHWDFIWDVVGPEAASTDVQLKPIQRQQAQEDTILNCLKGMGVDPFNFPQNQAGKKGGKADVRKKLEGNPLFIGTSIFDKAWERLRRNGNIVTKKVSP